MHCPNCSVEIDIELDPSLSQRYSDLVLLLQEIAAIPGIRKLIPMGDAGASNPLTARFAELLERCGKEE
jgi:hypothetical protein